MKRTLVGNADAPDKKKNVTAREERIGKAEVALDHCKEYSVPKFPHEVCDPIDGEEVFAIFGIFYDINLK